MNTLTKNRIIEKGDEFLLDGKWQPVPAKLHGMQVMFTGLTQVRRPNEEPSVPHTAKIISHNNEPISPDRETSRQTSQKITDPVTIPAKAESDNPPVPSHSGTGDTLPTIVSKKAHSTPTSEALRAILEMAEPKLSGAEVTTLLPLKRKRITLDRSFLFPLSANKTVWTGRNGTFNAIGINFHRIPHGRIRIVPQGKRGEAKNALIEFPVEVIPDIIEWLKEHQP